MRNSYERVLEHIAATLHDSKLEVNNFSLYTGLAGNAMFSYYYAKYIGAGDMMSIFEKQLASLSEQLPELKNETFCSGRSGIHWLFSFLYKEGIIYLRDKRNLCDVYDANLKLESTKLLEEGRFDFLHGSMGLYHYLLYNGVGVDDVFYPNYIEKISLLFKDSQLGRFIPTEYSSIDQQYKSKINLGLSHGMPSVLRIVTECYQKKIATNLSKEIAYNLIDCLLSCKNEDTLVSYFPAMVDLENRKKSEMSRLGWCYGDLGVAYALLQAGEVFCDQYIKNLSLEILEATTKRRDLKETGVNDFGLCHGIAGVAHVYFKLWKQTKISSFKKANQYWMSQLMLPAQNNNFVPYYQKYYPSHQKFGESYSLLEGAVGIGLTILSCMTADTCWDYCLMLNE